MEGFDDILRTATERIADLYFQLPVARGDPTFRERVYCYELYHQVRRLWPEETAYSLNGEVDKGGHPFLVGNPQLAPVIPDFLVHEPGRMDRNFAIIEVKHCLQKTRSVKKDLATLSTFVRDWGYLRAIYLVYGGTREDCLRRILLAAQGEQLQPIELWHHGASGTRAHIIGRLQPQNG